MRGYKSVRREDESIYITDRPGNKYIHDLVEDKLL